MKNNTKIIFSCIVLIGSSCLSYILGKKKARKDADNKCIGNLHIDNSEPDEGKRIFLELKTDIPYLSKQKYVKLKIIDKNYLNA